MSPQDAATIYLSTFSVGILRTTDRGDTLAATSACEPDDIYAVAINPQNDAILYAGTAGNGLFRSLDDGATWQHSQAGFRNADVTSLVLPSTSEHLFTALFGGGVMNSQDGGASLGRDQQRPDGQICHPTGGRSRPPQPDLRPDHHRRSVPL